MYCGCMLKSPVGVEQEEAGEKWRAGDAAKSLRFFIRAITTYDQGLGKHPASFDLAYNKYVIHSCIYLDSGGTQMADRRHDRARVEYEITQHPKLSAQLQTPQINALQAALESHKVAVNLDQENADCLFNTAQVLTSLAEVVADIKRPSDQQLVQAVQCLQEALEIFQRCFVLQELRFTEMQEQVRQMEAGDMQPPENVQQMQPESNKNAAADEDDQPEQWAAVVEPVTKDTLVDTAVAQLDTLTTLCNLLNLNPGDGLPWVEEYSSDLVQNKMPAYVEGSTRQYEASMARARFLSALAEVLYRSGRIEVETYHQEITRAFGPDLDLSADAEGLCSKADAFMSFNSAAADLPPSHDAEALKKSLVLRWQSLSTALDGLTAASRIPDADNLPKIHLARGDVEMNRWRLGREPWEYAMAQKNASLLLRNSQTYYRGAAALARRDGAVEETRDGTCKEALAAALEGSREKMEQLKKAAPKELLAVAEDMVDDGLAAPIELEALLS